MSRCGDAWIRDVVIETKPLATTGGHTWKAAHRLLDFLEAMATPLGLYKPGIRILELGAGCGYVGITLARNLPQAGLIILTEQEEGGACEWLSHNVEINRVRLNLHLENLRVDPCDWLQCESIVQRHQHWDLVIGSDLIYNSVGSVYLPRVMALCCSNLGNDETTKVFYCHTKHRYDLLDCEFFEQAGLQGLDIREVCESENDQALKYVVSGSPPMEFPPQDLFPEQRIALYMLTVKQQKQRC